ncbi:MAG: sensor histidine kinase [Propionibacteriaceae bacterium]|nr:sensor histidine kinase [Propionibacteriaceae bacterium]
MRRLEQDTAPAYNPGAVGLPWWRRALAQGAGYFLPSTLFVAVPFLFAEGYSPLTWVLALLCAAAIIVFFLGTTLVAHWPETARWLWVLGLMASIGALGWVTDGGGRPLYFISFVTSATAVLLPWRQARVAVIALPLGVIAISFALNDMFGVVMGLLGMALGWGIGSGIDRARIEEALRTAEERTAVLAVAAERERIGRDLHDILGHSLTAIAVKADLAGRLVGRSDDAARAEIEALASIARQALADVRATASGMREVRLATEVAAARSVLEAAGVECRTPSALPVLDDARSEVLGYVVREAVTNVVRHAGASVCTITADEASVSVADDGHGMRADAGRTGLRGLGERVRAVGGALLVTSGGAASGAGTTVRAELPPAKGDR